MQVEKRKEDGEQGREREIESLEMWDKEVAQEGMNGRREKGRDMLGI